jgi:uncharacterized repeat protein (TIGR01451 family)
MNTKLNFLMVLALLVMLVGASATPARADAIPLSVGDISIVDQNTEQPAEPSYAGHVITSSALVTGSDAGATCTVNFDDQWGYWQGLWITDDSGNLFCTYDHQYFATGTYAITITVTNSDGITTASSSVNHQVAYADVRIVGALVADASLSGSAEPSLTNQAVVAVGWLPEYFSTSGCTVDYGEGAGPEPGTFGQGWPPNCKGSAHTYATPGSYTLTMVVTGFNGSTDSTSITHVVVSPYQPLTIGPETILDGTYGVSYDVTFTATGGNGLYDFELTPDEQEPYPAGMSLGLNSGEFTGTPQAAGTFGFTITAGNTSSAGSKHYTWAVQKATPAVTVGGVTALAHGYYSLSAQIAGVTFDGATPPTGTFAYAIDGNVIPGCDSLYVNDTCGDSYTPRDLTVGAHTVTVTYTPDDFSALYYTGATGTATLTIEPAYFIRGTVFNDLNYDKFMDPSEPGIDGWYIDLSDCTSAPVLVEWTDPDGKYSIGPLLANGTYCISIDSDSMGAGWAYTVLPKIDSLTADVEGANIGVAAPAFSPENFPDGSVGVPYNQTVSLKGGIGPFTIQYGDENLPTSLQHSFNTSTGAMTLSGTPTDVGVFGFNATITDSVGTEIGYSTGFTIAGDPNLTFTSSLNPSTPDQAVTFTVSSSSSGSYDPFGTVTFSDGSTVLCSDVPLNGYDENTGPFQQPATCTTSALAAGSHTITAAFTSNLRFFNNLTKTLTQVVTSPISADLSLTKTDSKDPVKPGAQLVYTLTVKNLGPNTAQTISLVDTLDRNTTYVSVAAPKGWTCKYANYAVICTGTSLASGSSAIIKITVTVNKTAKVGKELVNNAVVSSTTYDPVMTNNTVVQKTLVAK